MQWIGSGTLVAVTVLLGAFAYDGSGSAVAAIGYGVGIALFAVAATGVFRYQYLRRKGLRSQPVWTPDTLAVAGSLGMIAVILSVVLAAAN